jgi:hypothetical protein
MLNGPVIQARCLECPMAAPARRRPPQGWMAQMVAAVWGA